MSTPLLGIGTLSGSATDADEDAEEETAGTGTFTYTDEDGNVETSTDGVLTIDISSNYGAPVSISVKYNGAAGDKIKASIVNEADPCSASFVITQDIADAVYNDNYITVKDENGNLVTNLTESNFTVTEDGTTGTVSFDNRAAAAGIYKLHLLQTDDSDYALTINADGFVDYNLTLDDNTADYDTEVELNYAYKIYPIDSDAEPISGAIVTAAGGIECNEVDSSGEYNCAIPLSNTDLSYKIRASTYDRYNGQFTTARTLGTDASTESTAELIKTDEDNDGVITALDCDDTDETISTNQTYYSDPDENGLGDPEIYISECVMTAPIGYVSNSDETGDTDSDGLTDDEESNTYFTDPENDDSDADNLSDYEEIFEFETDPNNSDTDGDGSPDGTEIDEDTDPLVSDIQDEDEDTDTAEDIDEDVAVVEDTDEDEDAETEKLASIEDCTPFEDIISHWSESDVCTLYTAGFVKGKSEKVYDPDNKVTRAEFLKLIMLEAGYDPANESDLSITKYNDVNPGDWYYDIVALADEYGFLWYPTNDNWLPNEPITRGDAILQVIRIAKLTLRDFTTDDSSFTDFDVDSYQAYAIVLGEQYEIIGGYDDGTFMPNNNITRAEAAVITNNSEVLFE